MVSLLPIQHRSVLEADFLKTTFTARRVGRCVTARRTQSPALWSFSLPPAYPLLMQMESATNPSHVCAWRGIIVPGTSATAMSPTPASSLLLSTRKSATSVNCAPNATSFIETKYQIWQGGRNGQTDFISLVCSTHGSGKNSKSYKPVLSETVRSITPQRLLIKSSFINMDLQFPKKSEPCSWTGMNMSSQRRRSYQI